ncbi:hypothetical protein ACFLXP_00605 [Chloroflexota bacterium]
MSILGTILRRNMPHDVIFLMPVKTTQEKLHKGKIRMLYCDAKGKLYASLIDKTTYTVARTFADEMEAKNNNYATIGLEIGLGNFAPTVVEISAEQSWALSNVLNHALSEGAIPDVLTKYLKNIIELGTSSRKATSAEEKPQKTGKAKIEHLRTLDRLPYYLEKDIEFSMPIYKAEHRYPLIVVGSLASYHEDSGDQQRLVILDNDGDIAIIKVPFKLLTRAKERLEKWTVKHGRNACLVIYREPHGYAINYVLISQVQRKALDVIAENFEEIGSKKRTIPSETIKVLTKVRDTVPSSHP